MSSETALKGLVARAGSHSGSAAAINDGLNANNLGQAARWGEVDSSRRTAARSPEYPQSPHASASRSFNGGCKSKQYGFQQNRFWPIAATNRTLCPAGGVLSVTDNPEDGQHENPGFIRRSRPYKAHKLLRATKNATRPRGDERT